MPKLRNGVVEDEVGVKKTLLKKGNSTCSSVNTVAEDRYGSKAKPLSQQSNADLNFLSVETDRTPIVNALKKMKDVHSKIALIISYYDKILKDIEVSSLESPLVQPIDENILVRAISQAERLVLRTFQSHRPYISEQKRPASLDKILVKTSGAYHLVNKKDIIRCEADVNYTRIYLKNARPITSARTLKKYENVLNDLPFLRVHQSHLININYLLRYEKKDGGTLILEGEEELPVSKKYRDALLNTLELFDAVDTNNK